MWTKTFWKQVAERVIVGAAIGASTVFVVGMTVWSIDTWREIAGGGLMGAFMALCASLAGRAVGDPDVPLATAPRPAREYRHQEDGR